MSGCPFHNSNLIGDPQKDEPTHYSTYLQIPQLLSLQEGPSGRKPTGTGLTHPEELTFIIVHQVFELWFKLIISDLMKIRDLLSGVEQLSSPEQYQRISDTNNSLRRCESTFKNAIEAFSLIETIHPASFAEFRDFLVPASGFQSMQFRQIEQILGLNNDIRALVNQRCVFSYLKEEEQRALLDPSLHFSLNAILENLLSKVSVPKAFIDAFIMASTKRIKDDSSGIHSEECIMSKISEMKNMIESPPCPSRDEKERTRYIRSIHAALFITVFRNHPRLFYFAEFLDHLVSLEATVILWRSRHVVMAERMIGSKAGTGGTESGIGYLNQTLNYRIFHCLWFMRKLLIKPSDFPDFKLFLGDEDPLFSNKENQAV